MEIILIDAENFQVNDNILEDIFKNHNARIKNLYADFSEEAIIKFWSNKVFKFGLEQKQTLKIQGKGSVDASLMLDALEYSFNQNLKKVIICGNDKDYIPLCKKLRDYNIETNVYGNGYSNIVHFCDNFTDVSKKINTNKCLTSCNFSNKKSKKKNYDLSLDSESDYFDEDDSSSEELNNNLIKIRNYLIDFFQKNHIKRIRVKNLKKAIKKNKPIYKLIRMELYIGKLDKSLIKNFPNHFKSSMKKGGSTCFISLK